MRLDTANQKQSFSEIINPYLTAFFRYWQFSFFPAVVIAALAFITARKLPDYYTADSVIFIQPPRITSAILSNQRPEEMRGRLESVIQDILSRPRVRGIIEKFKLYPEIRGEGSAERSFQKLRSAVEINPVKSETGFQDIQTFSLQYTHHNPEIAFAIAKEITNLFVEESVVKRKSEVQGTEEFLDAQLGAARTKLEETEKQVQEFVRSNFGKLPEHLDASIARLQNMQSQLGTNSQMLTAAIAQRSNLDKEIENTRLSAPIISGDINSGSVSSDPKEQLARLESALLVLKSQYSDKHPDVIRTQARIDALKIQIQNSGPTSNPSSKVISPVADEALRRLRRERAEIDIKIQTIQNENEHLKESLDKLQLDIEKMPLKEQELLKIKRDYANVQANYDRLLAAREEAGLQSSLLKTQKATQFRVLQPPELPAIPAGPNRSLIMAIGAGIACVMFIGGPLLLFFLNSAFKFRQEIEEELGVQVIGVIPAMESGYTIRARNKLVMISAGFSLLVLAIGYVALVVFVL